MNPALVATTPWRARWVLLPCRCLRHTPRPSALISILLVAILLAAGGVDALSAADARILYVSPTSPMATDSGDCTLPQPCLTIQAAVDKAAPGDEVRVAAGVYQKTGTEVVRIAKSLILRGGYSPANWELPDPVLNASVIDGQTARRGIVIETTTEEGVPVTISGFEIRNCNANSYGGGVWNVNAALTLEQCVIHDNIATNQGAGVSSGGTSTLAHLWLRDSSLYNNRADAGASSAGSALAVRSGSALVEMSRFHGNQGRYGTVSIVGSEVQFRNNLMYDNTAAWGGGIAVSSGTLVVENATFQGNSATETGGGIYVINSGATAAVTNTLFVTNTAVTGGGALAVDQGTLTVAYSDFFHNSSGGGDCGINNNRCDLDPRFVDAANADFRLTATSPARDTALMLPPVTEDVDGRGRPYGAGWDRGAHEYMPESDCYARPEGGAVFTTVQAAVDAASPGDVVQIAGVCRGVSERGFYTQTVYLDKGLTLRGAYTTTDWVTPRYGPTVLDAQGQGRVLTILATGTNVTVENLHLTGGAADLGGGVYAASSSLALLLRNSVLYNNSASDRGGGLYNGGVTTADFCVFYGNGATNSGGGIYALRGMALRNSVVANNSAATGGGVYRHTTSVQFTGDYNAYHSNAGGDYGNVPAGPNDLRVAPGFEDAAQGDFHLDFASPLINAADPAATVTSDFESEPRPGGDVSDMGVDERHTFAAVVISPGAMVAEEDPALLRGQTFTFTHTITNTGHTPTLTDTYDIEITNSHGWDLTTTGQLMDVTLGFGEGHTLQIGVTVPGSQPQGFYNTTSITVTSRTSPQAFATAMDTIANPGLLFTPSYTRTADPGETITYTHVLTNIGPPDVFELVKDSSQGWATLLTQSPVALDGGESLEVTVVVTVAQTAPADLEELTLVRATATLFGVSSSVSDRTVAKATAGARYVQPGGVDTINNCTVPDAACRTVAHAVQQAVSGDAVYIAEGDYTTGELLISKLVDLQAGYRYAADKFEAVEEVVPEHTTLNFGGASRGIRVTAVGSGTGPLFSGFRILGANTVGYGGAILLEGTASAWLQNLIIEGSEARRGGALYVTDGVATLDQVKVISATAQIGGALYNESGTLAANRLTVGHSQATVGAGGALFNDAAGNLSLTNSLIYSNTAATSGGGIYNAGMLWAHSNTVVGNGAAMQGGGLYDVNSVALTIRNTIFAGNAAATGGGLYQAGPLVADTDYNAYWANEAASYPQRNLPAAPHDVEGDPLFVDVSVADYHLTPDSSCLDTGDPLTTLTEDIDGGPRPSNQGYDIGADELRGCLARVLDPGTGEQVGEIFNGIQQAVDFAPTGALIQISGTCFGVQPRSLDGDIVSQTVFITRSLTLRGGYLPTFEEEYEEPTYLDALGYGRVLVATNPSTGTVAVALSRLTLRRGWVADNQNGAVIYNDDDVTLDLEDIVVSEGETGPGGRGGGLYNQSGALLLLGETSFVTNTAGYGGALYNLGVVTTYSQTRFAANMATSRGGGLYNSGGAHLQLDAATVLSNRASQGGGLYNAASGVLVLTNSMVASNTVSLDGGGLFNLSSGLVVRHDTFFANAGEKGAAMYHDAAAGALINSTLFVSNTGMVGGAAIFSVNAQPVFTYNGLHGNAPGNYSTGFIPGVGIVQADPDFITLDPDVWQFLHISSGSSMEDQGDPGSPLITDIDGAPRPSNQGFDIGADEVGDCYIRINGDLPTYGNVQRAINQAQSGDELQIAGTCLGVNAATVGTETWYQTAFIDFSLGFRGGYTVTDWAKPDPAVYTTTLNATGAGRVVVITGSPVVTMTGLHLVGGLAPDGGGIYVAGGVVTLTQNHVYSHTATNRGGGIYHVGGQLTLDGLHVHDSTAATGGGLYQSSGGTWLHNTFFYRNSAQEGAGVYNGGTSPFTVRNNTFYRNQAQRGGGLYTTNHTPVMLSNLFDANTGQGHAVYSSAAGYAGIDYSGVSIETGAFHNVLPQPNVVADAPGFVDSARDNFRLRDDSPMLDAGDPATTLLHDFEGDLRPSDQGFDIGADERRSCWARIVRGGDTFGPYGNPQLAVDLSEPGDWIQVTVGECQGVHPYVDGVSTYQQTVHITHNLRMTGGYLRDFSGLVSDPLSYPNVEESTIFSAGALGRALLIAQTTAVTVERVNLARGDAAAAGATTDRGGVFYATTGQVLLSDSGFYDSLAVRGGAVAFGGSALTLERVKVYSNTATLGGGFYASAGVITVTGTSLVGHNHAADGGALYVYGGKVYVGAGAKVHDNIATGDGGGVYIEAHPNGSLTVAGAILAWNRADGSGGGIYGQAHSNLTVDFGSRLHNNTALQQGGAVYGGGNNFRLHNALIYSNTAREGAGVFVSAQVLGDPQVQHNTIVKNLATSAGGGVYVQGSSGTAHVRDNIFDGNTAGSGSAVYADSGILSHNDYWPAPVASQVAGPVAPGPTNFNDYPFYVGPLNWLDLEALDTLDFHLLSYSPLIDVGLDVGLDHDMDGHPRPVNAAPDVGADEYPDCLARVAPSGPIFGQIQAAINYAAAGGVVQVAEGVCEETLNIGKDISIYGSFSKDFGGRDPEWIKTYVTAGYAGQGVLITNNALVYMDQIAFTEGFVDGDGGCIYVSSGSDVTLQYVNVSDCWATGRGGGMFIDDNSTVQGGNVGLTANEAEGNGGGIYNAGDLSLGGSTFWYNAARGSGGAIYSASGAQLGLANSSLRYNSAGEDSTIASGGALYNASPGLLLGNVAFLGNKATGSGGGVYNTANGTLFEHNTVVGNLAAAEGDGVYNTGTGVTFNAGIVAGNGGSGGEGIYSTQPLPFTYSLMWQNSLVGVPAGGAGNLIDRDPRLSSVYPTYVSPAIDAVPWDKSDLTYDHVNNPRRDVHDSAICAKDMGYHEYTVGRRGITTTVPISAVLVPAQTTTYTVLMRNVSEEWRQWGNPLSSMGPGTGYTETIRVYWSSSQEWAAITGVDNVAGLTINAEERYAQFSVAPGDRAAIRIAVTIPVGQLASIPGDPTTWETTRLNYTTVDCREPLNGSLSPIETFVAADRTCRLTPERSSAVHPGETVSYTHVITNIGNITTTYAMVPGPGFYATAELSPTGLITQSMAAVLLGPGEVATVTLRVTIRPEVLEGLTNITTLIGRADGQKQCSVADTTSVLGSGGIRYVAPNGFDSLVNETLGGNPNDLPDNNCTQPQISPCQTLQHAVAQANAGEEIRLGTGVYTTVYTTTVGSTVYPHALYVDKPLTVTGGYQESDWSAAPPNHSLHATVLDAQGAGRVIHIATTEPVYLSRLTLQNGDATGQGGGPGGAGSGGNLYNAGADLALDALRVITGSAELGGGVFSAGGALTLTNNLLYNNGDGGTVAGGALYIAGGDALLLNNTLYGNYATEDGAAIYHGSGSLTLRNNLIAEQVSNPGAGSGAHAAVHVAAAAYVADYNLWYSTGGMTPHVSGLATTGTHSIQADPDVVDPSLPDLHLLHSSPAREAGDPGTNLNLFPGEVDQDNQPRRMGLIVDLGAYEFVVEPSFELTPAYRYEVREPSSALVYTHTLRNTGEFTDTFDLVVTSVPGWIADLSPASPVELAPGAAALVTLTGAVPPSSGGLLDVTIITATSRLGPGAFRTATDETRASFTPAVTLLPTPQFGATDPGVAISYPLTVTNAGDGWDNFGLSVTALPGWTVGVAPATTPSLAPGLTTTVTVTVIPPAGALSGTIGVVTATAASTFDGGVTADARIATTVNRLPGLELAEDQQATITYAEAVAYTHTLTNTGNATESIDMSWVSSEGWTAEVLDPALPVVLGPGASIPVTFRLMVPPGSGDRIDVTTLTAYILGTGVQNAVVDVTTVQLDYNLALTPETATQDAAPGDVVVFNHTLTNLSNITDTYDLSLASSQPAWTVRDPVAITLPAGVAHAVVMTVTVPLEASAGPVTTVVTAQSRATGLEAAAQDVVNVVVTGVEISGLYAFNDSPTDLGQLTTLSATIESGTGVSYVWAFGDGATGSGQITTHLYPTPDLYTATVTASNALSSMSATTVVTINAVCEPVQIITVMNDSPVMLGQAMAFTATVTGSEPVTYTWDFGGAGDPTGGDTAIPVFLYAATGSYTVTLTVENGCAVDTLQIAVSVTDVPVAGLYAFNDSPTLVGNPTDLWATLAQGTNVSYTWAFGDQTTGSGINTTHTYTVSGVYTAIVTATNATNQLSATTTVTITGICESVQVITVTSNSPVTLGEVTLFNATVTGTGPMTYTWDFGGTGSGGNAGSATPTYTYGAAGVYTVTLDVSNPCGVDSAEITVDVQPPADDPVVELTARNDSPTVLGNSTAFTATTTGGTHISYAWAFGDGVLASGATPTHAYATPGTYMAVVTASNSANILTATTWVTVTDVPINELAAANDGPTELGQATVLMASTTEGTNVTYTWAFGDGATGSGASTSHVYAAAGTYTATVTAANSAGQASASTRVTVFVPCVEAQIVVLASNSPVMLGQAVHFTATVTGSAPVAYAWTFGGAGTATGATTATPSFVYNGRGTYTVNLAVSNDCGSDSDQLNVSVLAAGVALAPDRTGYAAPGTAITHTHTLTNTGNLADTFDLTTQGSLGWPVTLNADSVTVPARGSVQITLRLNVPALPGGSPDVTTLTARSQANPTVSDTVTDTTYILSEEGALLAPDHDGAADPGTTVHYEHILTNTGSLSHRFLLRVEQEPDWQINIAPSTAVDLPAGASRHVTVTVVVPAGSGGVVHILQLLAEAEDDPMIQAHAQDRTIVSQLFGVVLAPDRAGATAPGISLSYSHVLTNTGNGEDTFHLAYVSPSGWSATVTPASVRVGAGSGVPVTVVVQVPVAAVVGHQEVIAVSATSAGAPTATFYVFDTTTVSGEEEFRIFLPLVMRNYTPPTPDLVITDVSVVPPAPAAGQPVTLYVTVRNQGEAPVSYGNNFYVDLYVNRYPQLRLAGDIAWGAQGAWFGASQSHTFQKVYSFPTSGSYTLRAQTDTDNTVVESREDNNISSPRVVSVGGAVTGESATFATPEAVWGPRPTPTPLTP